MPVTIPPHFEEKLLDYIKHTYLPERFKSSKHASTFTQKDVEFFAIGAAELSDAFTAGRKELPKNYFNRKENRSAYLLYFTLTNFAKVMKCLDETYSHCEPQSGVAIPCTPLTSLDRHVGLRPPRDDKHKLQRNLLEERVFRILDLGCGPATASIACSTYFAKKFPKTQLFITGIDQNREILSDARNLFSILGNTKHSFKTQAMDINANFPSKKLDQKYNLIIAANFLNEVGDLKSQQKLCHALIDQNLTDDGAFIILDPALQKTTRNLMELRDNLLNMFGENVKIASPCLHEMPCPMLTHNRRDWCHFYLEWECPKIIRDVDELLGIRHNYLKMAYLIVTKTNDHRLTTTDKNIWRAVSSPLLSRGKSEMLLCGSGRLRRITRLDKNRSRLNYTYDLIKRGDLVELSLEDDRIIETTKIEIIRLFNTVT